MLRVRSSRSPPSRTTSLQHSSIPSTSPPPPPPPNCWSAAPAAGAGDDTTGSSISDVVNNNNNNNVVEMSECSRHRPKHPMSLMTLPEVFECGGCREYGAGKRLACQECDYQLHDFCALSPPLLTNHPLHPQHQLVFHSTPNRATGGGSSSRWRPDPKCHVCGKPIKGFTFRCRAACTFQMHPCCAMLSTHITFPDLHPHSLYLLPPQLVTESLPCNRCNKKRPGGRVYRCTVCHNYHLHALCAKPFLNGLQQNGLDLLHPPKHHNTALTTAARLASQVVIEFIGGLIEGFGEGVGQALLQSIDPRGRRHHRRRPTAHDPTTPTAATTK